MPEYRHSGSEAMFPPFVRARSHLPGLSERLPCGTLLFKAIFTIFCHYIPKTAGLSTVIFPFPRFFPRQQHGHRRSADTAHQLACDHGRQHRGREARGKAQMVTEYEGR